MQHKEQHSASVKQWSEEHEQELKQYRHEYYLSHKEQHKESMKKWHIDNPGKQKELQRNWCNNNKDKVIAISMRRRARKLNAPGNGITAQQSIDLKAETGGRCVYCGQKRKLTIDHVVPLISGGADDISNAVPACQSCNSSKGTKSLIMFLYSRMD